MNWQIDPVPCTIGNDGLIHAILGGYLPSDEDAVQRLCDFITTPHQKTSHLLPTCPHCFEVLRRKSEFRSLTSIRPVTNEEEEEELPPPSAPLILAVRSRLEASTPEELLEVERAENAFFSNLSIEVGAWSVRNFGENPPHRQVLGMIEELLELSEALDSLDRNGALDAIGDIIIYMADYHAIMQQDMGHTWAKRFYGAYPMQVGIVKLARRLAHHRLKGEQNIRGGTALNYVKVIDACAEILGYLESISVLLGSEILRVTEKTWSRVSKRDWVTNPNTAAQVAEAEASVQG